MRAQLILLVAENDLGCWARTPNQWGDAERSAFDEAAAAYGNAEEYPGYSGMGYFFADWSADELTQEITALARDEGSDATISPIMLTQMKSTVLMTIDAQQTESGVESTLLLEPIIASPAVNAVLGAFAADYPTMTETSLDGSLHLAGLQGAGARATKTLVADLESAGAQVLVQAIETKEVSDVA